jgi:hypothetical protein
MNGNPALPGGLLTSKPTWSNTSGCSATSAFFSLGTAQLQDFRVELPQAATFAAADFTVLQSVGRGVPWVSFC